ncbi:unnamed protein product [Discosporangium mesarthrocarpum]
MAVDVTREWIDVLRGLRRSDQMGPTTGGALTASQWRWPRSPFLQQALELNVNIRAMHKFLIEHFLDYVDVHSAIPSQKSLMSEEERDMIDLEVNSFMTACAAGVDALKALLQRERLRRIEQEQVLGEEEELEGSSELSPGYTAHAETGPANQGGLLYGSRPAHQHATVTYLFERLQAVTSLAEMMQAERHKNASLSKVRFYAGPGSTGGGIHLSNSRGKSASNVAAAPGVTGERVGVREPFPRLSSAQAKMAALTPEEEWEEAFLGRALSSSGHVPVEEGGHRKVGGGGSTAAAFNKSSEPRVEDKSPQSSAVNRLRGGGRGGGEREEIRGSGYNAMGSGGASGFVHESGGERAGDDRGGEGEGGGLGENRRAVLEEENRDLLARLQNELDDARLVESKMSEVTFYVSVCV